MTRRTNINDLNEEQKIEEIMIIFSEELSYEQSLQTMIKFGWLDYVAEDLDEIFENYLKQSEPDELDKILKYLRRK